MNRFLSIVCLLAVAGLRPRPACAAAALEITRVPTLGTMILPGVYHPVQAGWLIPASWGPSADSAPGDEAVRLLPEMLKQGPTVVVRGPNHMLLIPSALADGAVAAAIPYRQSAKPEERAAKLVTLTPGLAEKIHAALRRDDAPEAAAALVAAFDAGKAPSYAPAVDSPAADVSGNDAAHDVAVIDRLALVARSDGAHARGETAEKKQIAELRGLIRTPELRVVADAVLKQLSFPRVELSWEDRLLLAKRVIGELDYRTLLKLGPNTVVAMHVQFSAGAGDPEAALGRRFKLWRPVEPVPQGAPADYQRQATFHGKISDWAGLLAYPSILTSAHLIR